MYRNIASVCGTTEISIILCQLHFRKKKSLEYLSLGRVMKDTFAFPLILFSI